MRGRTELIMKNEVSSRLAENLAMYRKRAGYTQKALGAALNVASTTVSTWERNGAQPDADMLFAISKLLKVSVSELYGLDSAQTAGTALTQSERELLRLFRKLNATGQSEALKRISELIQLGHTKDASKGERAG